MRHEKITLAAVVLFFLCFFYFGFVSSTPNGASVNPLGSSSYPSNDSAGNHSAYAGNITEVSLTGYSTTQSWQGYYGNVSGTIQLADSNRKVLYNWSISSPGGEVYASTNSTIIWTNIQCFNFTARGTYASESGAGGTTNLYGTNLTILQQRFNISSGDVDAVNETFNLIGIGGHASFNTGTALFDAGECPSTRIFDSSGSGVQGNFEEVLLYEPETTSVVFASLLEKDLVGYDGAKHDFEMIVLENGHGGNVETTTYYFFLELQ